MCYVLDSRQVLANILRNKEQIRIDALNEIASKLQEKVPSICVDVSHYSISAALEDYPSMFLRLNECEISKVPDSQDWFSDSYIDVYFNQEIPRDIREAFLCCLAEA